MRFRAVYVIGITIMILCQLLLLTNRSMVSSLTIGTVMALDALLLLVFAFFEHEFSSSHAYLLGVLFVTLLFLVVYFLGQSTISTFFLIAILILLHLLTIAIVLLYGWQRYHAFDRMIDAMRDKKTRQTTLNEHTLTRPQPPLEVKEPPRVRLHETDEGEWVEIKVPKQKAKKAMIRKNAKKRAQKRSTARKGGE